MLLLICISRAPNAPTRKVPLKDPCETKVFHPIITRYRSRAIWAHQPLMKEGRNLFIWCLPNKWSLNFQIFMGESPQDQELMVSSCLELPAWQLSLQVHFLPPLGWLPPCLPIQKDKTQGEDQRACNSPYCLGRDFLDVGFRALKTSSAQRLLEAPRLGWCLGPLHESARLILCSLKGWSLTAFKSASCTMPSFTSYHPACLPVGSRLTIPRREGCCCVKEFHQRGQGSQHP